MKPFNPKEYKLVSLRECPLPDKMQLCDTPDKVAAYWEVAIKPSPLFNPECECFFALLLNTRRRVKAHVLVPHGTLDTILVHPREVFRAAITAGAAAVVLAHNLCVAAHRLCYVTSRVVCRARLAALTRTRRPQRKECCGCA